MRCGLYYHLGRKHTKSDATAAPSDLYDYYINYTYKPDQKSLTQSVLENGEALVIQNAEDTSYISQSITKDFKTKSGLGLPMIVGDQKLGAILVGFNSKHEFSPSEVEWGGVLAANHIALALHKSCLINELKKSNQDKDRFFSILSHDLKSPFSGVEHLVTFLTENQNKLSDKEIGELLNTLKETTTNLNVLIDNILSWSRLNRGLFTLNLEQFALSELIEEVLLLLEYQANEKKYTLKQYYGFQLEPES